MQKARLEDWFIDDCDRLVEASYGHPNFTDGSLILTSRVVTLNLETNKALTKNTEYELGKPAQPKGNKPTNKGE